MVVFHCNPCQGHSDFNIEQRGEGGDETCKSYFVGWSFFTGNTDREKLQPICRSLLHVFDVAGCCDVAHVHLCTYTRMLFFTDCVDTSVQAYHHCPLLFQSAIGICSFGCYLVALE